MKNRPRSRSTALLCASGVLLLGTSLAEAQSAPSWTHYHVDSLPGFGSLVNGILPWDPDGPGPIPTRIAICGFFHSVDGVPANSVALLDEGAQTWSPLGNGLGFEVVGLAAAPNGDLVAGGIDPNFFPPKGRVDIWSQAAWASLPLLDGQVASVAVLPNGDIIAGGTFTTTGGPNAGNIARWNGTAWVPLGTGLGNSGTLVRRMEVRPGGILVASTQFTPAGGANPTGLASWDGVNWTSIGNGASTMAFGVSSFHYMPSGDILASGAFLIGGVIHTVARWDGVDWNAIGSGITSNDGPVVAVSALGNGDCIAGGFFTTAGGANATNVAHYDGSSWSQAGAGLGIPSTTDQVLRLHTTPAGITFAGGSFPDASGAASSDLAWIDLGGSTTPLGTDYCASLPNSTGLVASLTASGSDSVVTNNLNLTTSQVPAHRPGIFFYGSTQISTPFGHGIRCVGGSLFRFPVISSGATGTFNLTPNLALPPNPAGLIAPGSTWNFQTWFRDSAAGPPGFNLSNGLSITFTP